MKASDYVSKDTKLIFLEKKNCSPAMFNIISAEFGTPDNITERATAIFAGGVALQGHQCGLLWGTALAVGHKIASVAETPEQAIGQTLKTCQRLANALKCQTDNINCKTIINTDLSKQTEISHFLDGADAVKCFKIADLWAPEAVHIAHKSLLVESITYPDDCRSCATRVVRKMGGSLKESLTVAGLAGGLGLSGNMCGALGAALWYKALKWLQDNPTEKHYPFAQTQKDLNKCLEFSNGKFLCPTLSGHRFRTLEQHRNFIAEGGCNKWIDILAEA